MQNINQKRLLIGQQFRTKREALNLTTRKLAEMAGIDSSQVSNFENGKANITINTLLALSECLEIDLSYFDKPLVR